MNFTNQPGPQQKIMTPQFTPNNNNYQQMSRPPQQQPPPQQISTAINLIQQRPIISEEIAVDSNESVKALESANALDKDGRDKILAFLSNEYRPSNMTEEIKLSSQEIRQSGFIVRVDETFYVLLQNGKIKLMSKSYVNSQFV